MFFKKFLFITIFFSILSCSTVPVTGRKQLTIYPDSVLKHQSDSMYYQLIDEERNQRRLVKMDDELHKKLNGMSARIEKGVEQYFIMEEKDYSKARHDYEINIIKDKRTVNAFAMPTGKIIFYTKILEIAENDDGIAAIMAHEMAHVLARHGKERMSQAIAFNILSNVVFGPSGNAMIDVLAQLGFFLPFSRHQEAEADYLGLVFLTIAGYDPDEAKNLWLRMENYAEGKKEEADKKGDITKKAEHRMPEFLKTHPNHKKRQDNFEKWIPEVKEKYSSYILEEWNISD